MTPTREEQKAIKNGLENLNHSELVDALMHILNMSNDTLKDCVSMAHEAKIYIGSKAIDGLEREKS